MFGMPPPLPTQSMTTIPPAMGQSGAPAAASSKIDPQQIPRPIPSSLVVMYDTRDGNQSSTPPVLFFLGSNLFICLFYHFSPCNFTYAHVICMLPRDLHLYLLI